MEKELSPVGNESRRRFLQKALYTAPAIAALGTLSAPIKAHASVISLKAPGLSNDGSTWTAHYDTQENAYSDVLRTSADGTPTPINDTSANSHTMRNLLKMIFGY